MWPLDRPARDVVRLPGETAIAWAVFDPDWYRATYPDVPEGTPEGLLAYYLDTGQALGHSPNRLFDEAWHRARYPGVAAGIAAGHNTSAFDSYCRRGCLDRSGHWLFDELGYRSRYPDLTDAILDEAEIANGYDHYLRHGVEEDRASHPLFDPVVYLAEFDPADARAIRMSGVFQHYLARIETSAPELRTSAYFDPAWYLNRYPEVAADIKAGLWKCALHHYLCNDRPTAFDPCEGFSEAFYLAQDPGLNQVIADGHFRNGYAHFVRFGATEARQPSAGLNLRFYAGQPHVKAALEQGLAADPFVHWLRFGSRGGLAKLAEQVVTDRQARIPFRGAAEALLPVAGRFGYDFAAPDPVCSVVVTARDDFAGTMATIAALRASTAAAIELIVIDRASGDETRSLERYVHGARVARFEDDIGLIQAINAGWQLAAAPCVLFLTGDTRLSPGSLDRALRRLHADDGVAAVAAMLIRPLGTIAEAGGIVWSDGGLHRYQADASPLAPEANFVREVDFGGLDCLMVRRPVLDAIGGLDAALPPAYAAADLGLNIARQGLRIIYDPSFQAFHDDAGDPRGPPAPDFIALHAEALAARHMPGGATQSVARHAGGVARRVLFIDDTVPLRALGSGFVRSNDLVHAMAELGYGVTVYPINGCPHDPAHVFGDMPETAEVMHTHAAGRLKAFLEGRRGYYDTVWICRVHNLNRVWTTLSQLQDAGVLTARVILDTEAVTPRRDALRAQLANEPFDLCAATRQFVANAAFCDVAVAVTDTEADILRAQGLPRVATVGHVIEPRPTPRIFAERSGMLFVGAIHAQDSPNYDSLVWFTDHVLPRIESALGWAARLSIAGYVAPGVDMSRFDANPRIRQYGSVADLTPLYNRHRVFVAPTRFAAGAPYKVLEAAAFGVPVVCTDLLTEELGWESGVDLLSAPVGDAAAFADAILAAHEVQDTWQALRRHALSRLLAGFGRARFVGDIRDVLAASEDKA
jgi:GT2 family glycosyltransferase